MNIADKQDAEYITNMIFFTFWNAIFTIQVSRLILEFAKI